MQAVTQKGLREPARRILWVTGLVVVLLSAGLLLLAPSAGASLPSEPPDAGRFPSRQGPSQVISSAASACNLAFDVVSSPNVGTSHNIFFGLSATNTGDAWAVGQSSNSGSAAWQTLVERWNGTSWEVVPSVDRDYTSYFQAVSARNASDVWAVGAYSSSSNPGNHTLIEHWDGTQWSITPSPDLGGADTLYGVSDMASNDVWAVGNYNRLGATYTVIEHWDGTAWSIFPSPSPGTVENYLNAVSAVSSNDAWAVGYYSSSGTSKQSLIEHWDGSAWSIVASPNQAGDNMLYGVSGLSGTDVWAAGYYGITHQTLIEHWDGTAWSVIPSPNPSSSSSDLLGISAVSATDVWVAGTYFVSGSTYRTLIEHWDGTAWSIVSSASPTTGEDVLFGIAATSAGNVWAAGTYQDTANLKRTLVEGLTISCPTDTPTSMSTSTLTPTLTSTRTASPTASSTSTRTPTATSTRTPVIPSATRTTTSSPTGSSTATVTSTMTATPRATSTVSGCWKVVPSPHIDAQPRLDAVTVIAPNDVWAVGRYGTSTLTEHWDGGAWSIVPSPNGSASASNSYLNAVAGASANDVWAVGRYDEVDFHPLTLHWDGTQWSKATTFDAGHTLLYGVTAISANDVWSVGYWDQATLTMHWDGTQWSKIPSPNPVGTVERYLRAVDAISTNDVWAVGEAVVSPSQAGSNTLVEHWDGSQWSIVPSPPGVASAVNELTGVSALSDSDVWAVGTSSASSDYKLTEHWDGFQWSIVPSADGAVNRDLTGVVAISANDVWAVGYDSYSGRTGQTLTDHWDGSQWSEVSNPGMGFLAGIAAASSNDIWAVGVDSYGTPSQQVEILRYTLSCQGTATTTSTSTPRAPSPTATRVLSTATALRPSATRTSIPPTNTRPQPTATSTSTRSSTSTNTPTRTATATPLGGGCQPVTWTRLVNATASGSTLQKPAGATAHWNSGGNSVQQLSSGDGSVQARVDVTNTLKMFGFSHSETTASYSDIDYAFYIYSDGTTASAYIYEGGLNKGRYATIYPGNVLKIAVEGGVVKYYRNSTLLHTSSTPPTYPLFMDASIFTPGAKIYSATFCYAAPPTGAYIERK